MNIIRRHQAAAYVAGAMGWTWIVWGLLIFSRLGCNSWLWKSLFVAGLSGPLVASLGVSYAIGGKAEMWVLLKRALPIKLPSYAYLVALTLPPLLLLTAAAICKESLHLNVEFFDASPWILVPMFIWLIFRSGPVNEEFGWRGFLLPRLLQKMNPFAATMFLGVIWTVWHWPLWFMSGVPHSHWPFALFALMLLPMNFLFTWLFMKTQGSLFLAILLHASINAAIKFIPILPPEVISLAPFAMWILLSWSVVAVLVVWEWRAWFGRPMPSSRMTQIVAPDIKPTLPIAVK